MLHIFSCFFNIKDSPGVNIVEDESNTKGESKSNAVYKRRL